MFGEPGKGVHAQRFLGLALNDTLMTIIAAVLTSYGFKISLILSLFIWFVGGELLHYGFGVDSAFLKMIGIKPLCAQDYTE
jgi:hypothetical protein